MSLAWVWFLIAVAAFTWATWLHMLLADANAEVDRIRDAVLEQAADDKAHIEQWDKELES